MSESGTERHESPFNVLTTTAIELQDALDNGKLTSKQIVQTYLKQIKKHNHPGLNLRAILSMPSEESWIEIAEILDRERAAGKTRSRFHGIPIIVKISSSS
jgi:amidase